MEEIWKLVPGFKELWVSNMGNVKSLNGPLKPSVHHRGYLKAQHTQDGVRKGYFIHRLVAITFIDRVPGKSQVNHKNGFKMDNRAENLEWCTQNENAVHSFRLGLQSNRGERNPSAIATDEAVRVIRYGGIKSNIELSKRFGLAVSTVEKIKAGSTWKHVIIS